MPCEDSDPSFYLSVLFLLMYSQIQQIPIPKYEYEKPQPLTAEAILEIRKKAGLSQVKFAAALGVSVKKVSAWEHGKATPDEEEAEKIREMRK